MSKDSLVSEELRSSIGIESESVTYEIERGMIQQFVRAIDDSNPLWQGDEHAKQSKHGSIIAPPTFIPTIGFEHNLKGLKSIPTEAVLHGSTELKCYQLVSAGDKITVTNKLTNVRELQGKMGKTLFMTFHTIYKNQRQEPVASCRQTLISYRTERAKHG